MPNTMLNPKFINFDSLTAMENFTQKRLFQACGSSFVGRNLKTFEDALNASKDIWTEGMEIGEDVYQQLKSEIEIELKNCKRKVKFNPEDGDEIDLERLYAGQDFWRTSERDGDAPGEFSVAIQTSTPWTKTPYEAMWRGIVGVIVAEILEEAGHRVRIVGVEKTDLTRIGVNVIAVELKGFADPMDRSSLINGLSGWYHRTVRLATMATANGIWDSRGFPIEHVFASDLDTVLGETENRMFVSDVYTRGESVRMVTDELQKFV